VLMVAGLYVRSSCRPPKVGGVALKKMYRKIACGATSSVNTGEFLLFFWKAISATPAVFLLHLELLYALYLRKSERATHSAPGNMEFVNGNSVKQFLIGQGVLERSFWTLY
jgi:hypothetical protein